VNTVINRVCVSPAIDFWTPEAIFMKLGKYITVSGCCAIEEEEVYHGTWTHLNGLIKKSLPSVCVSPYLC
jgi:hypothetical protein